MVSQRILNQSVLGMLVLLFSLGLPTQGEGADWKAKWDKIVAAAKKEGQVHISGLADTTHPDVIKVFNKRYPEIKVVTVFGRSELIHRIVAERRARKYLGDVFATAPRTTRAAYQAGYLQPIRPHLILPEVTDESKWYIGKHFWADTEKEYLFTFEGTPASASMTYNTNNLTNPETIRSYWDVLDSKYRGKIVMFSYGGGLSIPTPMMVMLNNPNLGRKFIKRFFEEMDVTLYRDTRQAVDTLGRGKFTICFMCRRVDQAKKAGLPIENFRVNNIKEAGFIGGGNSSIISYFDKAPHPNAAIVFINWFLSREGQITWQRVLNQIVGDGSDSFRNDIPKDDVNTGYLRTPGKEYRKLGFLDPKPHLKFYGSWSGTHRLEKEKAGRKSSQCS